MNKKSAITVSRKSLRKAGDFEDGRKGLFHLFGNTPIQVCSVPSNGDHYEVFDKEA